jgi:hypothetical protein
MAEPNKCGIGSLLLTAVVSFLGALVGGLAGSLLTFYVLAPAHEAKAAVDAGTQTLKEGAEFLRQALPKPSETLPAETAKKDPNDKSEDPVEAARYFFDNIWAERQDAVSFMSKSQYHLDGAFNFLKKDPLPRRDKALERSEVKEMPAIDEKTRVFSWTPTTAKGTKIELRVILVRMNYRPSENPFWWQVERIDASEAAKVPEGVKK